MNETLPFSFLLFDCSVVITNQQITNSPKSKNKVSKEFCSNKKGKNYPIHHPSDLKRTESDNNTFGCLPLTKYYLNQEDKGCLAFPIQVCTLNVPQSRAESKNRLKSTHVYWSRADISARHNAHHNYQKEKKHSNNNRESKSNHLNLSLEIMQWC